MTNKNKIWTIHIVVLLLSSIIIYAGHFLFEGQKQIKNKDLIKPDPVNSTAPTVVPWKYETETIDDQRQEINIIEIDLNSHLTVKPALSHDLVYGFENLSDIASRKKACAAVNGGFFSEYGFPSGMVAIDGRLITGSSGKYPVFMISEGKASFRVFKSEYLLDYGEGRLKIDRLNTPAGKGESAVYTPDYGSTDRIDMDNFTVTVRGGVVTKEGIYDGEVEIPEDGMLITFSAPSEINADSLPFKTGDTLKLVHEPDLPSDVQAYECGAWIVKDGEDVVGERDAWVGVLTNHDPRTAIGIEKNGKVVLITVDGRQPGYSAGMTGEELAGYLLGMGVINAAMLDGGASTEMIVDGKVVNKPSFKGQERPLGGGLLVTKDSR